MRKALLALGGSNPAKGEEAILTALVEVASPLEHMSELFALGQRRLKMQQELRAIPNPTGYLIGIMRYVAVEAMLKEWNVAQMRAEDEEKHAQALQSRARGGSNLLAPEAALPDEEVFPPAAGGYADADPPAASDPVHYLPDRVEVADAATVATWHDSVPDAEQNGQSRRVSMLWGFVRDAISEHLNIARKSQLLALVPKWDEAHPRTLLLLSDTPYGASAAELNLRRELEPQIGKLLSQFFDDMQVVYAPGLEEKAEGV